MSLEGGKREYSHQRGRSGIGKKMLKKLEEGRGEITEYSEKAAAAASKAKTELKENRIMGAIHEETTAMHDDTMVYSKSRSPQVKKAASAAVNAEHKAKSKLEMLEGGKLEGGELEGGRHHHHRMAGGEIEGGELEGGRHHKKHHRRHMRGGSLEGGDLEGGKLEGGKLEGGNLEGGKLEGGKLEGGELEGGKLEGGKLEGGELEGGELEGGGRHKKEHTKAQATKLVSKAKTAAKHAEYDAIKEETGVSVGHGKMHKAYREGERVGRKRERSLEEKSPKRESSPKRELPARLKLWTRLVHEITGSRAVLRKDNPLYAEVRARFDREA